MNKDSDGSNSNNSNNVVELGVFTKMDIPPDRVLTAAIEKLQDVVIVGWENETGLLYLSSSTANGPEVLWLLEKAKERILSIEYQQED